MIAKPGVTAPIYDPHGLVATSPPIGVALHWRLWDRISPTFIYFYWWKLFYNVVLVSAAQQSELVFKLKFSEPPSCNPETIFVIFPPAKKNEFYWVKSVACKGYCLFFFFLLSNIVVGMGRKIFSTNGAGTTGYPWEEWWGMNLDPASHHTPLFGMDRRFYQAQNPKLRSFWKKA